MIVRDSGPHVGTIERLQDELAIARDRIKELELALGIGDDLAPYKALGLSPSEARLVCLLTKRIAASKPQLMAALYADDPGRSYDAHPGIIDVVLHKARKKLKRYGVTVGGIRPGSGDGYHMPPASKAKIKALTGGVESAMASG